MSMTVAEMVAYWWVAYTNEADYREERSPSIRHRRKQRHQDAARVIEQLGFTLLQAQRMWEEEMAALRRKAMLEAGDFEGYFKAS